MSEALRIDLTTGLSSVTPAPQALFGLTVLGGTPARLPVHHPDQPIVFGAGGAAGRRALALTRFTLVAKSPLSGGVAESRVEGPFGPALRDTGYSAVVLTGRAARPSYVLIDGRDVSVIDAGDLWGLDTSETTDRLTARHGRESHVAAIGPAGENLVRFASLITDRGYPAARMGAVFGAKRCKAVVVLGGTAPELADPRTVGRITADYQARIPSNPLTRNQFAAPGFGAWAASGLEGYLGVRNYTTASIHLPGFGAGDFTSRLTSSGGCPGCPQECMKSFTHSPLHQLAVAAFAANLGIGDLDTVLELNARCHRWGVDPVSLAGVLAYRCEIPGGPGFGDSAALIQLAEEVVHRSAEGAALSDGVARAVSVFGPDTELFALHSKGIEMSGFDPRGNHGLAVAFAVHPLGPRYDAVEHDIDFDPEWGRPQFIANAPGCPSGGLPMASLSDTKIKLVANLMELWSGYDAIGVCLFAAPPTRNLSESDAAELVSAATGRNTSPAEIRQLGRQRLRMMRDYNIREGLASADDTLPERFFTLPVDSGRLAGAVLDRPTFTRAVDQVRGLLGWR
ncbi:MAG: aldehyde ferredoxin oxidoreductase C-terminal domain-containing protein [Kibdelosporangium sp.]